MIKTYGSCFGNAMRDKNVHVCVYILWNILKGSDLKKPPEIQNDAQAEVLLK